MLAFQPANHVVVFGLSLAGQATNDRVAGRQFLPRIAVSLGGHEAFQQRPPDLQQPSHQVPLDQVDALPVGCRLFHKLFHLPQLLLRLEKRTLLGQDHGWASWSGKNDLLPPFLLPTEAPGLTHQNEPVSGQFSACFRASG
jgi:hypothetical protein